MGPAIIISWECDSIITNSNKMLVSFNVKEELVIQAR